MGRAKLQPGENTINSVKSSKVAGRGWVIRWSGRDFQGVRHDQRSQGATVGQARTRAKEKWEKILAASRAGSSTAWSLDDSVTDFIDKVVKPAIDESPVRPRTKDRYRDVLAHFRTATNGRSIRSLTTAAALKSVIKGIAEDIGVETARQTRSVVSSQVIQQLIEHGLLTANPIAGVSMPFTRSTAKVENVPTVAQWRTLLDFLLFEAKPNDPMPGKKSPQAMKISARQRHARVLDLTVLQMATGLRISEALALRWEHVTTDKDGQAWVTVVPENAKTKRGRTVPVLVPEVSKRLAAGHKDTGLVIPQPTDPNKAWERGGAGKAVRDFYSGLATEHQEFEFLENVRSHIWRKVLTTATVGVLPPHIVAAFFGHTPEMSRRSYTDATNVKPMLEASKSVLFENTESTNESTDNEQPT